MFDHPFLITLAISILSSFIEVIFFKHSFLAFLARFLNFPYWAVILIFLFFAILRNLRATRAYKLLHTIYHENATGPAVSSLRFTSQPDEFGLT